MHFVILLMNFFIILLMFDWMMLCAVVSDSLITEFFFFLGTSNKQVIAEHLSVEEVAGIKEGFQLMDTGNKGKINMDELRVGLQKLGHQIPEQDLQILMEAVSATMHLKHLKLCIFLSLVSQLEGYD